LALYREYGPSFHYDLDFRQNKINVVKFDRTNYLTPRKLVNIKNCYTNEFCILLDSLEVFQIKKVDFLIEEFTYNENFNSQFIDKDFDNNFKDNDNGSDFEINNKKHNNNNEDEKENLINYTTQIPINNLKNPQDKKNKIDKINKDLNEEINDDNENNEKIENKEINNNIIFDNFISDSIKEKSEKEKEKLNIEDKENYKILFDNEIKEKEISKNVDIIEEEKTNNLEEKMEKSDFYNYTKLDYSLEEEKKKKNNL